MQDKKNIILGVLIACKLSTKYWQIVTPHPLPKDLENNQPELSSNRALCFLIMLVVLAVNVEDVLNLVELLQKSTFFTRKVESLV